MASNDFDDQHFFLSGEMTWFDVNHLILPDLDHSRMSAAMTGLSTSIPPSLSACHIPSPSSVPIGPLEQDAIYFFETSFATMSPKTFLWSVLAVLLRHACDNAAAMHLLLAFCLGELGQRRQDKDLRDTVRRHFKSGAELLVSSMDSTTTNHCGNMMSFLLLQFTYRAIWDHKSFLATKKLSASIATYIKRHRLLEMLSDVGDAHIPTLDTLPPSPQLADKSMVARFLLFSAYEDLDAGLCNAGRDISRLVLSDNPASEALFRLSQTSQGYYFGKDYPIDELLDDIERSGPLELHFHINVALSRINTILKESSPDLEELRRVESDLRQMTQVSTDGRFVRANTCNSSNWNIY